MYSQIPVLVRYFFQQRPQTMPQTEHQIFKFPTSLKDIFLSIHHTNNSNIYTKMMETCSPSLKEDLKTRKAQETWAETRSWIVIHLSGRTVIWREEEQLEVGDWHWGAGVWGIVRSQLLSWGSYAHSEGPEQVELDLKWISEASRHGTLHCLLCQGESLGTVCHLLYLLHMNCPFSHIVALLG